MTAAVIQDLRDLKALTATQSGAQRPCWSPGWKKACELLKRRIRAIGLRIEVDEAGNQWAAVPGESESSLLIGSHLDSVPDGGWLDGALGVFAALHVLRTSVGRKLPITVQLVNWADEEGRFGRSLYGSSACAGTLDRAAFARLKDRDGHVAGAVLAENGISLRSVGRARRRLRDVSAYIELHIEQGPVLERQGRALAAVTGTFGVERHVVRFVGRSSHAGSTPMDMRHDAMRASARFVLAVSSIARRHGGTGTVGQLSLDPGIPTAIAGGSRLTVDLRNLNAKPLQGQLSEAMRDSHQISSDEGVEVTWEPLYRIEPVHFDAGMIGIAATAASIAEQRGAFTMPSGPLHDATEMARAGIPTGMIFVQSLGGVSHSSDENSRIAHIKLGVTALQQAVSAVTARLASKAS